MAFNGSGTFLRVRNWVSDAAAGIKIRADYHDSEDDNFAAGITNCIAKDGQTTITQNIPFNGKRITGLGDPTAAQDAVTRNWVDLNVTGGALIADTPPAAGKVGNLWWDSDSGNLFLRYDDGSSVQWVQVNVAAFPEAPNDNKGYVRQSGGWTRAANGPATGLLPVGGTVVTVTIPNDADTIDLSVAGMQSATANFWAYLTTTGATGYSGNVSVLSSTAASTLASNGSAIYLTPTLAANTVVNFNLRLRRVMRGSSCYLVCDHLGNTTSATLLGGHIVQMPSVAGPTALTITLAAGTFASGDYRVFWQ